MPGKVYRITVFVLGLLNVVAKEVEVCFSLLWNGYIKHYTCNICGRFWIMQVAPGTRIRVIISVVQNLRVWGVAYWRGLPRQTMGATHSGGYPTHKPPTLNFLGNTAEWSYLNWTYTYSCTHQTMGATPIMVLRSQIYTILPFQRKRNNDLKLPCRLHTKLGSYSRHFFQKILHLWWKFKIFI